MQNRKLKPSADTRHASAPDVADLPVAIADASTASVPSPARGLQASLQQQLEGTSVSSTSSRSIPFGWTALGMVAFCTAFWTAVVYVLN